MASLVGLAYGSVSRHPVLRSAAGHLSLRQNHTMGGQVLRLQDGSGSGEPAARPALTGSPVVLNITIPASKEEETLDTVLAVDDALTETLAALFSARNASDALLAAALGNYSLVDAERAAREAFHAVKVACVTLRAAATNTAFKDTLATSPEVKEAMAERAKAKAAGVTDAQWTKKSLEGMAASDPMKVYRNTRNVKLATSMARTAVMARAILKQPQVLELDEVK